LDPWAFLFFIAVAVIFMMLSMGWSPKISVPSVPTLTTTTMGGPYAQTVIRIATSIFPTGPLFQTTTWTPRTTTFSYTTPLTWRTTEGTTPQQSWTPTIPSLKPQFRIISVEWRQGGKSIINANQLSEGPVEVNIKVAISGAYSGPMTFEIRRDFVAWYDDTIASKTVQVNTPPSGGTVDVSLEFQVSGSKPWNLRGYFIRGWIGSGSLYEEFVYDETDPMTRIAENMEIAYSLLGR